MRADDVINLDLLMEVAEVSVPIVLEAGSPLLEKKKMSLKDVVDSSRVQLPFNGRDFHLISRQPGWPARPANGSGG